MGLFLYGAHCTLHSYCQSGENGKMWSFYVFIYKLRKRNTKKINDIIMKIAANDNAKEFLN